jgi:hypothetical protein
MNKETRTDKGIQKDTRIGSPTVKRLFTLKEGAGYLGRPVSGVRTLIWKGKLPYVQEGRKQYIDIRDLDLYIERTKTTFI